MLKTEKLSCFISLQTMGTEARLAAKPVPGHRNPKKRRLSLHDHYPLTQNQQAPWPNLQPELLELILQNLSFTNILHFKSVCSSWRSVADSFIRSSLYTPFPQLPCLLFPAGETEQECDPAPFFFSLEDNKVYMFNNDFMTKQLGKDFLCFGSSHGWLLILDNQLNLFVLNPFSQARIHLPSFDYFGVAHNNHQQTPFITKAIFLSDPSRDNYFKVVVIYKIRFFLTNLAFFQNGECKWTGVSSHASNQGYFDIMHHNNLLYALKYDLSVQVWDFNQGSRPAKKMDIKTSIPNKVNETWPRDLVFNQCYMVESNGNLLLVVRTIGYRVNGAGKPVDEGDLLTDEDTHPLLCPYRTLMFQAYKLDFEEEKWVEVEDLNDGILFLGGNHSMSLSAKDFRGCKGNSIYFTDDNWDQMYEDYFYGGHDYGIYSLQEKIVKPFYRCDLERVVPPPFWIVPNPW